MGASSVSSKFLKCLPKIAGRARGGKISVSGCAAPGRLKLSGQPVGLSKLGEYQVITGVTLCGYGRTPRAQVCSVLGISAVAELQRGCFLGSRLRASLGVNEESHPRRAGNTLFLLSLRAGDPISGLEVAGRLSFWSRAPGVCTRLMYVTHCGLFAHLMLPSGLERRVRSDCIARLGALSFEKHNAQVLGSAGRARRVGARSLVRGIAKNPVDHPNGGRTNSVSPSRTP